MRACELARLLAGDVLSLCRELLPNGKKDGNEYVVGDIDGSEGKSLKICISGNKAGIWKDFAGSEDDGGDLIGLIMRCKNINLIEACKYAHKFLGIEENKSASIKSSKKNEFKPVCSSPDSIFDDKAVDYLINERKLLKSSIKAFKLYSKNGYYCFPYYIDNVLVRVKSISLERDEKGKKIVYTTPNCPSCLFGWQTYIGNEREVIITEGEIDCITYWQHGYFSLSIPTGAKGLTWLEEEWDRLELFDTIYISFDMDKEGQDAALILIERLGRERCKLIKLPCKDINELLQQNPNENIDIYIEKAESIDPEELKDSLHFWEKTVRIIHPISEEEIGVDIGFITAKGKIFLRPHELSIWTGITGSGKSQLLGQIALHVLESQKCLIASFEMRPERTLARMVKQYEGIGKPSHEKIADFFDLFSGKLFIYDVYGAANAAKLLNIIEYSYKRYDITFFIIDSLMMLDICGDDYNGQAEFIKKLLILKDKFKIHINLVAHPRKKMSDSDTVGKLDIRGNSDISNLSDNIFCVYRNITKERLKQKQDMNIISADEYNKLQELVTHGDVILRCDKQRNGQWEGDIQLWYNSYTGKYRAIFNDI